jgi:hypothetical protein
MIWSLTACHPRMASNLKFINLSLAGKYSDETGRANEWFARGKTVSRFYQSLLLRGEPALLR